MKAIKILSGILLALLAACQSLSPIAPTASPPRTLPPATATNAPLPTQPPAPADTPTPAAIQAGQIDEIAGIWLIKHPHWEPAYLIVRPDGKYTFASNVEGKSGESGTLWFEEGIFLIKDDFCSTPGQYSVGVLKESEQSSTLVFTPIEDGCTAREKILTAQPAAWYGPLESP